MYYNLHNFFSFFTFYQKFLVENSMARLIMFYIFEVKIFSMFQCWQLIIYFLRWCFLSSITTKTFTGLDCILVTRRVSYKKQELLTLREHLSSPPVLVGSVLLIFLAFCVVLLYVFTFWVWRWFPHKNYVRFVFTSSCLYEGSCLIFFSLFIVASNTYCVVFLLCWSLSCVLYVASFSGLSIHFWLPLRYSQTFISP